MVFKYIFGLGSPGDAFIEASKKEFEIFQKFKISNHFLEGFKNAFLKNPKRNM